MNFKELQKKYVADETKIDDEPDDIYILSIYHFIYNGKNVLEYNIFDDLVEKQNYHKKYFDSCHEYTDIYLQPVIFGNYNSIEDIDIDSLLTELKEYLKSLGIAYFLNIRNCNGTLKRHYNLFKTNSEYTIEKVIEKIQDEFDFDIIANLCD